MAPMRKRGELTESYLHYLVLKQEGPDCHGGISNMPYHDDKRQRGTGCIHYEECRREVRKRYMQGSDARFDPPN